jgi:hypothetical protein
MANRPHRLEQAGGAGGELGVPDLGLDRPERAPLAIGTAGLLVHRAQRAQFGHVPALVPVPCASISSTVSGAYPASAYARRSARACPSGVGA